MSDRDPLYAEIARLRAENDELRERLRQADERDHEFADIDQFRRWRLASCEMRVLALLVRRSPAIVAHFMLHEAGADCIEPQSSIDVVKVHMCHLRRRLAKVCPGVVIENVHGVGYRLPPASKSAILTALERDGGAV